MTKTKTTQLADSFASVLRSWLTPDEFAEMQMENASPDYAGNMCASHNYCDANMAMFEAFTEVVGHEPNIDDTQDMNLWADAWTVAKTTYLTAN